MGDYTVQRVNNGLILSYLEDCECIGTASFLYNRKDNIGVYTDPFIIPRGIYNVYVTIPSGSCINTKQVTLSLSVLQGSTEILNDSITANNIGGFYVFPFSSIDMKSGLYTGQYPTETRFKITCS
jgi:hypothetical protein